MHLRLDVLSSSIVQLYRLAGQACETKKFVVVAECILYAHELASTHL